MQTQRDHVHAYQFLMGRMSSALVLADPASAEVPAKRAKTGLIAGVVLALLIGVGFGVYGLFVPGGSKKWQAQGAIVVEKETGTRFVNAGGVLHPTLNFASAKLLQGAGSEVKTISQASLAGAPRGGPIGIPDAPQTLPPVEDLAGSHWLVCLPGASTGAAPGRFNLDFDPTSTARQPSADQYLPVRSVDGTDYLLWQGRKHRIADPSVQVALGMANARPSTAPPWWLDAVPDGPVLAPARIDGAGSAGSPVGGTPRQVGQLFEQHAANGGVQRFVLRADGLAPLSETEFALLAAQPGNPAPERIGAAAVAGAPRSADRSLFDRIPDLSGAGWQSGADSLCLRQNPAGDQVRSQVVLAAPRQAASPGGAVNVRPGTGLVAGALPIPAGQRVPDRYLITDQGTKHLVPDDESMQALGFGSAPVRPISNELLAALPDGPVLSRAAMGVSEKG